MYLPNGVNAQPTQKVKSVVTVSCLESMRAPDYCSHSPILQLQPQVGKNKYYSDMGKNENYIFILSFSYFGKNGRVVPAPSPNPSPTHPPEKQGVCLGGGPSSACVQTLAKAYKQARHTYTSGLLR